MEKRDINLKVLKNCYKNAQIAILSLDDVIEKTSGELKEELINEHDGYQKHLAKMSEIAIKRGVNLPTVTPLKRGMLNASIELKTMADGSNSHVAEMTLKGTVMGVTELIKDIAEYGHLLDNDVLLCVTELKNFEENCEKQLKKFL